jgi:hypothetical protein
MGKFKKKPVEIEAIRWVGDNFEDVAKLAGDQAHIFPVDKSLRINTLEGIMECPVGWWVIKGIEGEIYSCKDSVFKSSYEQVDW